MSGVVHGVIAASKPAAGGSFPTNAVKDSFTGTNGTDLPVYSANWSNMANTTAMEIQSNAATGVSGAGNNAAYWNVANYGPNCEVYCTLTTKPADNDVVILLLGLTSETDFATVTGYGVRMSAVSGTDFLEVIRIDAGGAVTVLGSAYNQEFSAGDAFGVTRTSGSFQIYYKASGGSWGAVGTPPSDSTYTASGKIGLYCDANACRIDEFGGGTI